MGPLSRHHVGRPRAEPRRAGNGTASAGMCVTFSSPSTECRLHSRGEHMSAIGRLSSRNVVQSTAARAARIIIAASRPSWPAPRINGGPQRATASRCRFFGHGPGGKIESSSKSP